MQRKQGFAQAVVFELQLGVEARERLVGGLQIKVAPHVEIPTVHAGNGCVGSAEPHVSLKVVEPYEECEAQKFQGYEE